MDRTAHCRRGYPEVPKGSLDAALQEAWGSLQGGQVGRAFDLLELLAGLYPQDRIRILAQAHDMIQAVPLVGPWELAIARRFDLGIEDGDAVLEISREGGVCPHATQSLVSEPDLEGALRRAAFAAKAFDVVVCLHGLEDCEDPLALCREIMRLGKRGYFQVSPGGAARWKVSVQGDVLTFVEGEAWDRIGEGDSLHDAMVLTPETPREKALAALRVLGGAAAERALVWEGAFKVAVLRRRTLGRGAGQTPPQVPAPTNPVVGPFSRREGRLRFLQVHGFYGAYLERLYASRPGLAAAAAAEQFQAVFEDAFSAVHMIAPAMAAAGYDGRLVVANALPAQRAWAREQGIDFDRLGEHALLVCLIHQIHLFDPDVLYLSDPQLWGPDLIVPLLRRRPRLVLGWRAAPILKGTDWREMDVLLSCIGGIRALGGSVGARAAEPFVPGMPDWVAESVDDIEPTVDVVFAGSWGSRQHGRRNRLLEALAEAAAQDGFSLALHLLGDLREVPPVLRPYLRPPVFGLEMQRTLRSGRVVFDGQSAMGLLDPKTGEMADVGAGETANMRIIEAAGTGCCLLTYAASNLPQWFTPGKEVETYHDEASMLSTLRRLLGDPERCRSLGHAARERTRREHSLDGRVAWLDAIVRRHMGLPPTPLPLPALAESF